VTAPIRKAPFVAQLRSRPGAPIRLGAPDEAVISVRVQMPEVWDLARFEAPPSTPVHELKRLALEALYPDWERPEEFVMKLNGFEVLDESAPLGEAGARDGSTFLLTGRRRRPVR
jgi:hypothetical protein